MWTDLMCVCVFQKATEGRGIDVIVEMLSNVNLSKDLQMLAYGGRVTVSIHKGCCLTTSSPGGTKMSNNKQIRV